MPAARAKIQTRAVGSSPKKTPTAKPKKQVRPEIVLYSTACFKFSPELSRMARSPSSWGSSSQRTATEMVKPSTMEEENAAPILRPSTLKDRSYKQSTGT
ncbi:hypothetical protein RvY_06376 [Ramazzottius varieornatus]|uniref:Uncharacterized protein n=1 Tax=Ramazzottius varieornatus TaxID=947166 RepID=A0A1D1V3V3_RAMVA|nr:hypothetical protein RvY_06376 [Ramazzottius varieornatus]